MPGAEPVTEASRYEPKANQEPEWTADQIIGSQSDCFLLPFMPYTALTAMIDFFTK